MAVTCAVMLGFALDALLGDPRWFPHPVCAVGKLISCMEKLLRQLFPPRKVCAGRIWHALRTADPSGARGGLYHGQHLLP